MVAAWKENMPAAIARRPRHAGLPIPWFVQQVPVDFGKLRPMAAARAHELRLCWWCGEPRYEKRMCFLVVPHSAVTRVSTTPPGHPECARWAVRLLQDDTLVVHASGYELVDTDEGGVVFGMTGILGIEWWLKGQRATPVEAMQALDAALPELEKMAQSAGEEAVCELEIATAEAIEFIWSAGT